MLPPTSYASLYLIVLALEDEKTSTQSFSKFHLLMLSLLITKTVYRLEGIGSQKWLPAGKARYGWGARIWC